MKNLNVIPVQLIRSKKKYKSYFACAFLNDYNIISKKPGTILHPEELIYFNSLKYENRKKSYLMGRIASKNALSCHINEDNITHIEIASGIFNQPIVKHSCSDTPEVSISHTYNMAIAITFPAGYSIGIDIEYITQDNIEGIKTQLTSREFDIASSSPLGERITYLMLWSMKEGLSKVLKCGLTVPLNLLEINKPAFTDNNSCSGYYSNFEQYKSVSHIIENYIISIVFPRVIDITLDTCKLSNIIYNSLQPS